MTWRVGAIVLGLLLLAPPAASAEVGPQSGITPNGRQLDPVGRMTALGAFPTGGALTPDGRFYWAVDAGRGVNAVRVIRVSDGTVVQTHQIPGGYVGIAIAPDGRHAYVSGQPAEGPQPPDAVGTGGDVIHVYDVDPGRGLSSEIAPVVLPNGRDGSAAFDELPPATSVNSWPEGLALTPGGRYLVVALGQADQVAIVDLTDRSSKLVNVGSYPFGVAIDPTRMRAYVTNERDGTVSVISIPDGAPVATIHVGVAGSKPGGYPHPEGLVVDPSTDRLYVAVTDRDVVSVIDTASLVQEGLIEVGRPDTPVGSAPVNVGVAPDSRTLYVANAGEDAIVAIALTRRPLLSEFPTGRDYLVVRDAKELETLRRKVAKARRDRVNFKQRVRKLKRLYLEPTSKFACAGPSGDDDIGWRNTILAALRKRDRELRAARRLPQPAAAAKAVRAAKHRYAVTKAAAKARLPKLRSCLPEGAIPGVQAGETLGRIPTAAYPVDVEVTPDGKNLVWLAARGLGTGPNPGNESIKELLTGRAGMLPTPTDTQARALTPRADAAVRPTNFRGPPAGTPVIGPGGGASDKIKHVFYIVRENRTYDQIFGSDPRGEGDPSLQVFDDNGVPGPAGGMTPNAHELSRRFSLMDHVFANTEESTEGHKVTAGGYANDYTQRFSHTNRGRKGNPDIFPIGTPPNAFIFDQAVRQGVPFRAYGEFGGGNQPFANEGRPTYPQVQLSTDLVYPSQVQGTCRGAIPLPDGTPLAARCSADSGTVGATSGPPVLQSRVNTFATEFTTQLLLNSVPAFNYLILFNDHTDGTTPGVFSPRTDIADNDLGLGQVVQLISQSSIWDSSAIFAVEDDSQDGADSVDAHRMPAFVISPWAKRGGQVISTRYDQYSFLRTAEMILGLNPLSINDALATPLYDAFISGNETPDVEGTRYSAIQPQVPMNEINPASAPNARLSAALPFDQVDHVPQRLSDRILWQSIYGPDSTPPPSGPNHSPLERARAVTALKLWRSGGSMRKFLLAGGEEEGEQSRLAVAARLFALTHGIPFEKALELLEGEEAEEAEDEEAEAEEATAGETEEAEEAEDDD